MRGKKMCIRDRRGAAAAEAVLKPLGGNCAVLPKGYLKTKNWIEFSAFQIYPKRFCGKNKNGNDIKRNGATMYRTIQHQMSIEDVYKRQAAGHP